MSVAQLGEITLKQTVTLAANTPISKGTLATLISDPKSTTTQDFIQIPQGERWIIADVFIAVSGDVPAGGDAYLTFEKNRRYEMTTVGPLSTMLISNQQRPRLSKAVGYVSGEILRVIAINIAAIGGANITDNFYMKILKDYT